MEITIQYAAREGSHLSDKDAAVIGPELDRLSRNGGTDALSVVEAAREPESPLHDYIEWSDPVAAEQWRLFQAGQLLRQVAVVVKEASDDGPRETMRAFHVVNARVNDHSERRYYPLEVVASNPDWSEQVVQRARGELRHFRRKYSQYQEYIRKDEALSRAFDAIHELDQDE